MKIRVHSRNSTSGILGILLKAPTRPSDATILFRPPMCSNVAASRRRLLLDNFESRTDAEGSLPAISLANRTCSLNSGGRCETESRRWQRANEFVAITIVYCPAIPVNFCRTVLNYRDSPSTEVNADAHLSATLTSGSPSTLSAVLQRMCERDVQL